MKIKVAPALTWDLQELFWRHAKEILQSLRRRGFSAETAADLTQDTFVRILAAPPAEAAVAHNPVGYLFRVARNLGIDHQRRERLLPRVDLAAEDFTAILDPAPAPDTIAYDRQRLLRTQAAIEELPERTRKAFELHRMEGMTLAAVAAELGLSTSRSWALIREAYEHIGVRLNGD
ncbi:sigma-70 family RNA polymerase sigma factor [Roseomonas sp. GC11]|uniref:RNA polymerase sigma factor n=1 Tax=Roseomonas sp. GC11 TaxID=2950546 RepID=UPI00210EAA01|nr:sigma-70 family RNA polymerase sigma factor [Roseomonas sp. GC11]MCQ4160505.1 sigma-70 family RNA polymerase sigma factor [Roseomonas sp. GC11]